MFDILAIEGGVSVVDGFYCDGVNAGLRSSEDVAFIYSDTLCSVDAVFTANKFQASPIKHFKKYGEFETNFVLINAKNANAMTGDAGIADIDEILNALKKEFPQIINPIMSSTGVIGVRIPKDKIIASFAKFDLSQKNNIKARQAIMTTDAYPKEIAVEVSTSSGSFKIGAMAKGAGMISPSLATMLCFITTDANVPKADIKELLSEISETTFNAISVDGDMSTNDTIMLLANGKSGIYDKEAFREALRVVLSHLSHLVVKDGEGAKKVAGFAIKGAKNYEQAKIVAKALSNSLLVKTALFGEDPNWGRIASTIGASGVECCEKSLTIAFEDIVVYDKGEVIFDKEQELKVAKILKEDEFRISCNLGVGNGEFLAFGCDLGYEYVKINADYRT